MPHVKGHNIAGKEVDTKKKKKLTPAQKKLAALAPPFTQITGADFAALRKKGKK